ncbi:hypothetical protein [Brevundimonas diminuta]|uniref:hypothetical protein n=1 Tax=Brevundimonas diminuta TaxID=293 RepID=UPI001177D666|nr:hypothetical protein [Brevundimonas diminuta]
MINLEDETRHVSVGRLSLFIYPWRQLEHDASLGDLFVSHLVHEAKPLVDPDDYLLRLQQAFSFRENYQDDIQRAADLGWYLVHFGDDLNVALLAKRVLWCVRTILIARSAERRAPVFAPHRLAEKTGSEAAREILLRRHDQRDGTIIRRLLRSFLEAEGPLPGDSDDPSRAKLVERFVATSNKVALQTLRQEEDSQSDYAG